MYSFELMQLMFELPYCRIQIVVDAGIAKRQAASRYLKELVKVGVLEERTERRAKLFRHSKYLQLLIRDDDFFEYAQRDCVFHAESSLRSAYDPGAWKAAASRRTLQRGPTPWAYHTRLW